MGARLRQRARRACLVAAAMCLLLSFGSPSSGAQEEDTVPRPEVFRGAASSLAASVQADRDALLPVPELFRFILLDGSGIYESSTRQARASLFFPGNGLILGPNLACGTFGGQFPEEFKPIVDACLAYKYPLTVFADDFAPDGATTGSVALGSPGDPVSGNAGRAKAHAGEDAATTDAVMQDVRVLGLPDDLGSVIPPLSDVELDTSVFSVDSATSRTNQRIVQGSLVADAEATLSGVRMIGGLVNIGSLRSESHVTDDAKGKRTAVASLEISGVTVGGVPAQITDKGLVLGGPSDDGPLAQQQQSQANELMRAFNVKATVLDSEQSTDKDGAAVANVGGVLIEFSRPVQGLPTGEVDPNGLYSGSFLLGATGVLGSAFTFGVDPVAPDPLPADVGGFDPGDSSFDGGTGGEDVALPEVIDSAPTTPDAPAAGDDPAPKTQLARSVGDLFGDRLGLLYLSLMLAVLGLCIVPRLTVPARLPGPRS